MSEDEGGVKSRMEVREMLRALGEICSGQGMAGSQVLIWKTQEGNS